ncbi:MAG: hypothetical protein M3Q48_08005, partial [Actinomycetota bacterium]|nr:hypothetical protein [Actinomycetota bacterium]
MPDDRRTASFGANDWLVDEMYERYRENPASVSESWQEFFADYRPEHHGNGGGRPVASPASTASSVTPAPAPPAARRPTGPSPTP